MINIGEGHVIMYAQELHSSGGDSTYLLELSTFPYFLPAVFYLHSVVIGREYLRSHVFLGLCLVFNWFMMFLVSLDASLVYSAFNGDFLLLGMFLNSLLITLWLLFNLKIKAWKERQKKLSANL